MTPNVPPNAARERGCKLCGLPVRRPTDEFCCLGCRHVYAMLSEALAEADTEAMRRHPLFREMQARGIVPQRAEDLAATPEPAASPTAPLDGNQVEHVRLDVRDMWCPSCAWVIERVLEKTAGVRAATASFQTDSVQVAYEPHRVDARRLARIVTDLGYRATLPAESDERKKNLRRELYRLILVLVLACNIMMISFALYGGFFVEAQREVARLLGLPLWLLATLVIFVGGWPILHRAWRALRARAFVMETLIAIGALAAYFVSLYNFLHGDLHQYFDTASELIALVLLGKYLEQSIRYRATKGVAEIYGLLPTKARLLRDGARFVSVDAVAPGDRVAVREGEPIPVDGQVEAGEATVDESKLTGEMQPRRKRAGDGVLGGSVALDGELTVVARAIGRDSALGRMVTLMEGALAAKNPMEKLADRLIVFFVPAVLVIALGTAAVLLAFGATLDSALVRAVTVLVIACPCALGIATPLAKVAAVSRGRRSGLLIADPNALENAARLSTLVLDKTGTATTGEYAVRAIDTHDADADEVIALAAAVEHGSTHPLARALRDEAARRGLSRSATRLEFRPGLGAIGDVDGHRVVAGNAVLLQQEKIAIADEWREPAAGETAVYVAWDGVVHGIVRLGDEPRPDMAEAIRALRQMGIAVHLVSGDTPMTTAHIAGQLGIERFRGGVLPDEKVRLVHELRRDGVVGMVGDGANDAAALAAADVGFATGDALTVTKHASDMVLLSFSGGRLLAALQLARRTHRTIRGNLVFALAYNLVALPLALSGIVHPLLAVTAMLLSSLTVVLNSARLARGRRTGEAQND